MARDETNNGWISLHRSIIDHWIWKDPVKLKWWLDILLVANHTSVIVNIGMQLYDCHRGQTIMSLSNWAKRWGVSRDTARNFLVLLEKDKMILHENIGKSTRITICNYDTYQDSTQNLHKTYTNPTHANYCSSETCVDDLHNDQTQTEHKANASQTPADTNNNVNNYNNRDKEKTAKRFTPPTLQEVTLYITEKKIPNVNPETFYYYYEANGWLIGKSKMKSWRSAVSNWSARDKSKKQNYKHPANDVLDDDLFNDQLSKF